VNFNFSAADGINSQLDAHLKQLGAKIKVDASEALQSYLNQYEELEKRLRERNVRMVAMDKSTKDLEHGRAKAATEPGIRIQDLIDAQANSRSRYNTLNDETKADMTRLLQDGTYYLSLFYPLLVDAQLSFYTNCAHAMSPLAQIGQSADFRRVREHPWVITSNGGSAMYSSASAVSYGSAPPSGNYGSAPGYGAAPPSSYGAAPPSNYGAAPPPNFGGPASYQQGVPPPFGSQPSAPPNEPSGQPRRAQPPVPGAAHRAQPPRPPGVKARALYDFAAQEPTELGFKAGDIVMITKQGGEWWTAEMNGIQGEIPFNYVELIQ